VRVSSTTKARGGTVARRPGSSASPGRKGTGGQRDDIHYREFGSTANAGAEHQLQQNEKLKLRAPPRVQPRNAERRAVLALLILLLGFVGLQVSLPLGNAVLIGADEGFELAKATLLVHGHALYSEVWNDQPPLHTFIVAQLMRRVSSDVLVPRLLTVVSGVVLLGGMFWLIYRVCGLGVACLTVGLMMASPGFLELSVSCMLEIPSLAPAVMALCVLWSWRSRWHAGEIVAGALFGAALLVKLLPVILLPLAVVIVWLRDQRLEETGSDGGREMLKMAPTDVGDYGVGVGRSVRGLLVFCVSMVVLFVAIEWLIEVGAYLEHFRQTWVSHFGPALSMEYGSAADHPFEWGILLRNWDLTIPAALGVAMCWHHRRRISWCMLPVTWLVLMLVTFAMHRPWWSYYYVHIALPLSWCAAIGIVWAWEWFRKARGLGLRVAATLFALCAISWMGARVYFQGQEIRRSPQLHSALVLQEIERLRPFARFLYADEPVYSFHAGIPMPPALAVLPLKRFWSGEMTNARLVTELESARPEILLLRNDPRERPFQDWLAEGYRLVYRDGQHLLFARREVARAAGY
jgi:hypothetical protein